MGARRKSHAELQSEERISRRIASVEAIASIVNNLIRWSGLVAIAYMGYRTVGTLAGQTTTADIGIRFFTEIRISEFAAWLLGAGGIGYGWRQRKLRRDNIERLERRVRDLEAEIDPKRTSSKLTKRGDTPREDR
jgi:hypothetical protein